MLDKDPVVIIKLVRLDAPRALVERTNPTVLLRFSPQFAINPVRKLELIFLVDGSSSMGTSQFKQARLSNWTDMEVRMSV